MSNDNLPAEKVISKSEHERILAFVTSELRRDLERAEEKLNAMELRACIAEWAVAGLMSRDLRLQVTMSEPQLNEAIDAARYIGDRAGSKFLHAAELAFKEHARHAELMSKMPPYANYEHISGKFTAGKSCWPRPYK